MLENIYKTKQKRGYAYQNFLLNDTSNNSPYYFNIIDIPQVFTSGKNIIKLGVDGVFLKRNQEIDIEILDISGEPVYTEYTDFQDSYGYHYVTVYVYDSTPYGIGNLTIVGVAAQDFNGRPVDSYTPNGFNIRWSTSIDIKSFNRNSTDIVFKTAPDVSVTQVLTPYKFNFGTYTLNDRLNVVNLTGLEIYVANNKGVDYAQDTTTNIKTISDIENSYNYFLESSTANTTITNIRRADYDVKNGYIFSEYNQYKTILFDSQSRLSKDMEGSIFSFSDLDYGVSMANTWIYPQEISSSYLQIEGGSGSLGQQLAKYRSKIVSVQNSNVAILDKPPSIDVVDSRDSKLPLVRSYELKSLSNVTGAFLYPSSSNVEVQSINLSSSYIQFTFLNLDPIGGDVYRIKTYAKEAGRNAEYYQLNDHIVVPPEFLIDSDKQNQAVYAKNKSDFFVYGEFTNPSVAVDYWRGFTLEGSKLNQYSFNLSSSNVVVSNPLSNALELSSVSNLKRGITSRYYQTYVPGQPYTLSFYCVLDDGCELEVYMSSTPLKDTVLGLQGPRAFNQSKDYFNNDGYNKFGKFIGKVSNLNNNGQRRYDNVVFDFFADNDGFGRPVLFLNTDSSTRKNGYVSSISITPLELNGYTPSILQFATTTPDSINILQDDDASLTQSLDIKVEYFNYEGKQSKYVTYIPNVQINMINEVPGFCTSEASKFNDHCPFYYEIVTGSISNSGTQKQNTNTSLLATPAILNQLKDYYFWPTFSLNNTAGYYWNLKNFNIQSTTYTNANLAYTQPLSASGITSSWKRYDPMLPLYNESIPGGLVVPRMYSASSAPVTYSATPIDTPLGSNNSTSPYDRRFYEANGVAVDRYEIAANQVAYCSVTNSLQIQGSPTTLSDFETYLKLSRLHFPATTNNYLYGFHENGGIYNVRFKIAKAPRILQSVGFPVPVFSYYSYPDDGTVLSTATDFGTFTKTFDWQRYSPETGAKLMVYIADIATPLSSLELVPGREGFFPPKNNIVTIGNGYSTTPTITFFDSGSGYNIDQYDIILVQYGEKAQLVFDASGVEFELDSNGYYKIYNNTNQAFWGGIISDIEWCKIGITTDPMFIKPANFNSEFSTFVPFNPPPRPTPPPINPPAE